MIHQFWLMLIATKSTVRRPSSTRGVDPKPHAYQNGVVELLGPARRYGKEKAPVAKCLKAKPLEELLKQ